MTDAIAHHRRVRDRCGSHLARGAAIGIAAMVAHCMAFAIAAWIAVPRMEAARVAYLTRPEVAFPWESGGRERTFPDWPVVHEASGFRVTLYRPDMRRPLPRSIAARLPGSNRDTPAIQRAIGWPYPLLECTEYWDHAAAAFRVAGGSGLVVVGVQNDVLAWRSDLVIPVRVRWDNVPRAIAVWMAFGIAASIVTAMLSGWRETFRDPSICRSCRYPLGTSPRCPECGAATTSKA